MLSDQERDDIRREVYRDLVEIERQIMRWSGSYSFLCLIAGSPCFTHRPVGPVLRALVPRSD